MSQITVVSPAAQSLRAHLEGKLPGSVAVAYFDDPASVDGEALQADIALGVPDALVPLLAQMPRLRWLQSTWAGVTPLLDYPRRDYRLSGVKGLFGAAMSEYVLGWLLARERRVIEHARATRWAVHSERRLAKLRLGIAGVGSVGREVAGRCAPFFAEVVGLNSDGRTVPGCDRCMPQREVAGFAEGLDALVLLLPHTPATTGLFGERELERLARGATLINAGRANALQLPAALAALESGRLGALVLDVLDDEPLADADPLWRVPGLYITSHSAAPTDSAAVAGLFLDNFARYRRGESLLGEIDFRRGY